MSKRIKENIQELVNFYQELAKKHSYLNQLKERQLFSQKTLIP